MGWIMFAIGALVTAGISDFLKKLASDLKDPYFANLVYHTAAFITAILLFLIFSRKITYIPSSIGYAIAAGVFISLFATFTFKALALGPSVSTVMPTIRIGAVIVVTLLGLFLLRDKITWNIIVGLTFSCIGIYLLFHNK